MLSEMYQKIFRFNDYNRERFIADFAAGLPAGTRVLDAGAGPCKYKHYFAHCIYEAQDFAKYEGKEHSYGDLDYVSDIADIPVEDGRFDCIICTEVFEHIPRPDEAVAEFSRIIRDGGALLITAPLGSGIHMAPYYFYGGFSPYWYEHFLQANQFECIDVIPNGGFFKSYGQETRRFLTMITPRNRTNRLLFMPLKAILAVWFRALMPFICYLLDPMDKTREFTVGYFVTARKRSEPVGDKAE
jgi:SAM-dependent methyltransferase